MERKITTIAKKNLVRHRAEMARVAVEVLEDPDFGKELSEKARRRLLSVTGEDLSEAIALSEFK